MVERITTGGQRRQGVARLGRAKHYRVRGRRAAGVRRRARQPPATTHTAHLTVQMRHRGHQRATHVIVIVTIIIITIIRTTVTRVSGAHFVVGKLTTLDRR